MIWTIPNLLTAFRVLAAPFVALAFAFFDGPLAGWFAFGLFALAALTDFVDGWAARRWGQVSEIGKMLDPIADKAMVVIALAALTGLIGLEFWYVLPASAILVREVLVSGLREYLGDVKLAVTPLAKWKTLTQMVAIGALLLFQPGGDHLNAGMYLGIVLLWISALLTAVTGWDYFSKGAAIIRQRSHESIGN